MGRINPQLAITATDTTTHRTRFLLSMSSLLLNERVGISYSNHPRYVLPTKKLPPRVRGHGGSKPGAIQSSVAAMARNPPFRCKTSPRHRKAVPSCKSLPNK